MKTKFEVGDKINVYDSRGNHKGVTIFNIDENGLIEIVKHGNGYEPKQCRKIVKKKGVRVTREMLANTINKMYFKDVDLTVTESPTMLDFFCKELGLDRDK